LRILCPKAEVLLRISVEFQVLKEKQLVQASLLQV
jgi:hypothetical protein